MNRRRTAAPVALAVALMCAPWIGNADEQPRALGIRAESARIDLGNVTAGVEKVATFTLHNDSAADVRILRAKPS